MPPRKTAHDPFIPPQQLEILLVEDNSGDVRLMREALKEGDVYAKLHVVRDGEQALSFLRHETPHESSPQPQLVLLDLNLPRKDGREVLSEMKKDKTLQDIPVVVLSNSSRAEDIRRAYDMNAFRYVTKPSDMKSLIELGKSLERISRSARAQPKAKPPATAVKPRVRSASQKSA
jgi:two-component system, chemotaxis family, response regulator Rcp1